jgi:hypothetical protein
LHLHALHDTDSEEVEPDAKTRAVRSHNAGAKPAGPPPGGQDGAGFIELHERPSQVVKVFGEQINLKPAATLSTVSTNRRMRKANARSAGWPRITAPHATSAEFAALQQCFRRLAPLR